MSGRGECRMACNSAASPKKRHRTRMLCFVAAVAFVLYTAALSPYFGYAGRSAGSSPGKIRCAEAQASTDVLKTRASLGKEKPGTPRSFRREGEGSRVLVGARLKGLLRNHTAAVSQMKVGRVSRTTPLPVAQQSIPFYDKTQGTWRDREVSAWWDGGGECEHSTGPPSEGNVTGTCGRRATQAGYGQRVISLTLYGNNPEYWAGLKHVLEASTKLYPGWTVRLHTDPRGHRARLCPLLRRYPHFHVCDVRSLPTLGDVREVNPMLWRVAPLGDPQVAALSVRDVDSALLLRDAEAVDDWLSLNKTWHVMRDFEGHSFRILGGLWGVRARSERHVGELAALRDDLFARGRGRLKTWGQDQIILAEVLWPAMQGDQVAHDSFFCQSFPETRPFPTERRNGEFVGAIRYVRLGDVIRGIKKMSRIFDINLSLHSSIQTQCPKECRPPEHPEWIFC
ncbi:uncharacterized protein LOC122250963 [Penaeus japonicus]|uniref:uncharacterized protein LOC122250963 n=1 Tax=Penaeus japonicus TaxID=27405 RepID=UPI001C7151F5|nr:uncharacterized protein LOC122250963 [Penaeus japonicus]